MITRMQTLVLLLVSSILISAQPASIALRSNKDSKKKDRMKEPHHPSHNPCSADNRQAPINCFCNPDNGPGNASKIECWIFGTDLTEDYILWNYFSSQPKIVDMQVKVRASGVFPFVPTKALEHLTILKTFKVMYGSIENIHPYAFANLTQLNNLSLTRNQIVHLQKHAFAYLPTLTELNLNENRISELHKDVFHHLPNLQRFYIAQNNLSLIQEGTFKELTRLLELDLSSNYISVLTNYTFTGLSELKRLDLNNNSIRMLGDLTFAELWVLEDLRLDSNQIAFISERAFAGLNYLKHLSLRDNQLTILPNNLLDGVPAIHFLDLHSNKLETLTSANVRSIIHNLYNVTGYLNIANNKLICDCRLEWLYKLKNESKNQETRSILEELTCYSKTDDPNPEPVSEAPFMDDDEVTAQYPDDYNDNYVNRQDDSPSRLQNPNQKRFLDIAPDKLPCPKKQENTESPYVYQNTPKYAEINSGSNNLIQFGTCHALIPMIVYCYVSLT